MHLAVDRDLISATTESVLLHRYHSFEVRKGTKGERGKGVAFCWLRCKWDFKVNLDSFPSPFEYPVLSPDHWRTRRNYKVKPRNEFRFSASPNQQVLKVAHSQAKGWRERGLNTSNCRIMNIISTCTRGKKKGGAEVTGVGDWEWTDDRLGSRVHI